MSLDGLRVLLTGAVADRSGCLIALVKDLSPISKFDVKICSRIAP